MTRTCPVCGKGRLNDGDYICKSCAWKYQTDMMQLAGLMPELELVAAKQASPSPRNTGAHGNQGNAPLPLRSDAFDLLDRIREYAINVSILLGHKPMDDESVVSLLTGLTAVDHFAQTAGSVQFAQAGHELIEMTWKMFVPEEPRTYAGECPTCKKDILAPVASKYAYCPGCGELIDLAWLRGQTLRRLRDHEYTGTARELSDWLTSWGLKVSKRSIQRWAKAGQITAGPEDGNGRRSYKLGSILKRLMSGDR